MSTAQIGIKLSLDGASQAEAGLRRVSGGMDKIGSSAASLRSALGGIGAALGGAISAREFIAAADAVTVLQNQLKLATGSTQAAGVAYEALFEIAQRSRVSFTELGSTYASIARAGESLGLSQQSLLTVTEAIGNAMTISGGSAASMQAALVQLSQGLASGQLRGEELNSVMEQTPRLAKALADGLGVTTGQLREMGAAGQLSAQQVITALQSQAATLRGEVAGAAVTVGQAMTTLQNSAVKAVGEFDKASGASNTLATAIVNLSGGVETLGKAFADNEATIKTTLGVLAGAATAVALTRTTTALLGVTTGVAGVVTSVGALQALVGRLNPVTLALLGFGAVGGGLMAYADSQKSTIAGMESEIRNLQRLNQQAAADPSDAILNAKTAERTQKIQELTRALSALRAQEAAKAAPQYSVTNPDVLLARAIAAEEEAKRKAKAGTGGSPAKTLYSDEAPMDAAEAARNAIIASRRGQLEGERDALRAFANEQEAYTRRLAALVSDTPIAKTKALLDNVAFLDAAFFDGAISAEQYDQAIAGLTTSTDQLSQKTKDLADAGAKDMQRLIQATEGWGRSFTDTLADMVTTGKADFRGLADSIVADLTRIQIQKRITDPLVKAGTDLLDFALKDDFLSFDGGGYTGNAPRSGGLDGKGGYLAMLHPRETVIDHTRPMPQQAGGGTVVVNQSFNFNGPADRTQVMTAAQLGAAMARSQMRDDMQRGRL